MAELFAEITRSLGRETILTPPPPPSLNPSVARLVHSSADLVEIFRQRAQDAKMRVVGASEQTLAERMADELLARQCRTVLFSDSPLTQQINLAAFLASAGIVATKWSDSTLDASYDVDAGITDVYRAVAETGSIVVRESVEQGRAVSLVPPIHFAILRKSQIVADLIDLMADIQRDGSASGIVIITGPSKTADIEMNLVVGVHGPGEVVIFLID